MLNPGNSQPEARDEADAFWIASRASVQYPTGDRLKTLVLEMDLVMEMELVPEME